MKKTKFKKAAANLGILNNAHQKITNVVNKVAEKYPITECLYKLKNMWNKPTYTDLYISPYAWYKLTAFINLVGNYEISGFGRIQKVTYQTKENSQVICDVITDVDIIKQEVKSAYVESDNEAVLDFIMKLPADQRTEWTLDWHSHVNMATSPSNTDWNNYADMLRARMGKQFPIMIVNKKGEATSYQIINEQDHTPIEIHIIKEQLSDDKINALYQECKEKVETLCTRAAYTNSYVTTTKQNWSDYDYDDYNQSYRKHWWEEDEEVKQAKAQGYVFDDDKNEPEYPKLCSECGQPLDLLNLEEISMGICSKCFNEALGQ